MGSPWGHAWGHHRRAAAWGHHAKVVVDVVKSTFRHLVMSTSVRLLVGFKSHLMLKMETYNCIRTRAMGTLISNFRVMNIRRPVYRVC